MKEITQESAQDKNVQQVAPGYAWLLATGLLLALIFIESL
jgi:hypothetical protein